MRELVHAIGPGATIVALLACKNTPTRSDEPSRQQPVVQPTSAPQASSPASNAPEDDTLRGVSRWNLRVTGALAAGMEYGTGRTQSFSFPSTPGGKLCVAVQRTHERCCIDRPSSSCTVEVQPNDLTRAGQGLDVQVLVQDTEVSSARGVKFSTNSIKKSSKGYALSLGSLTLSSRSSVEKLLFFLDDLPPQME